MSARSRLAAAVVAAALVPMPFAAAEECLTMREQRAAIRAGEVVRPALVRRTVGGEVLRLSLCVGADGLVYRVVVLRGDGRVSTHVVDARTGALVH